MQAKLDLVLSWCRMRWPRQTWDTQIEKEMLAIVFSLEKFHQFSFGRFVQEESDQKPLEAILQKPLSDTLQQLQGMILCIQAYDTTICYKKGTEIYLADTLPHAYLNSPSMQEDLEYINMVGFLPIKQEWLTKLKKATDRDNSLQHFKSVIMNGWQNDKQDLPAELILYHSFCDKMSVQDGLTLKESGSLYHSQCVLK